MRACALLGTLLITTACSGNDLATRIAKNDDTIAAAAVLDSIVPHGTQIDTAVARLTARGFTCARSEWRVPVLRCATRAHTWMVRDDDIFVFIRDSAGTVPLLEVAKEPHFAIADDSLAKCATDYRTLRSSAAGGIALSERVDARYSYATNDGRNRLQFAAIVRGLPEAARTGGRRVTAPPKPRLPPAAEHLTGIAIQDLWIHFDPDAHVVWVDTMQVKLDSNNVVLVERADSAAHLPMSALAARVVNDTLFSVCAIEETIGIRTVLERAAEVRAFINPQ